MQFHKKLRKESMSLIITIPKDIVKKLKLKRGEIISVDINRE